MNRLGRVADPEALSKTEGRVARLRIGVPPAWSNEEIEIDVPRLLACAACDQGGCDRCGRSGAVRLDDARRVRLTLPTVVRSSVVRIPRPFDEEELDILLVEIVSADTPSPSVHLTAPVRVGRPAAAASDAWIVLVSALVITAIAIARCGP